MELAIERMNPHARMVLCGLIGGYNDEQRPPGPSNFGMLLTKRVALTGFIASDHFDRSAEIERQLAALMGAGALDELSTACAGFDSVVDTFVGSFSGTHVGKLVVRVDPG